jgi:hypothetical protein
VDGKKRANLFVLMWYARPRFGCQFFGGRFPRRGFARDLAKIRRGRAHTGRGEPKLVVNQILAKKVGYDQYFGKAATGTQPNRP